MKNKNPTWNPKYKINSKTEEALKNIETDNNIIENTPLSPKEEARLRHEARVKAVHYSTKMAGNKLTLEEVEEIVNEHEKKKQK